MEALWFCLVAVMIAAYVVMDGFDIGAGIIHFFVARSERERRVVLRSIGPVWDGNEVWLLAGGGTLYFAFPGLYASSFSGFYLPLMMVLWLLILRGISIEFRNHIDSPVWKPLWDAGFMVSSALLAIFFGAALGNVVRGVPLDSSGRFFLPLWTDFGVSGALGILDWYTISVGILAFLALTQHGALWVALKTEVQVQLRARRVAQAVWFLVVAMTTLVTILSMRLQPQISANLRDHPWGYVFPAIAVIGLMAILSRSALASFLGSCAYLVGMLTSAAFGVFPYVLPARPRADFGLTIHNTATSTYGLQVGLAWWIPGMALAIGYIIFTYRHFAGKVRLEGEGY
ncbi:MAG: cytochrome d ubiquinol oxidase subunit II [Bryobacteraceae bacterium]